MIKQIPIKTIHPWIVFLLASACGAIVANVYYAQPVIGIIAPDIGMNQAAASLIVTLTQCGYCAGLILLVPLGDLVESRRLISVTLLGVMLALVSAAYTHSALFFLFTAFCMGFCSVVVQMLIPLAAHMTPEVKRGQVVGTVMSGLLLGIMLARPISSIITDLFGWRIVFSGSATIMIIMWFMLRRFLPVHQPAIVSTYSLLIGSMWQLLRDTPILRRRAIYQAALFAAFTLYWTTVPLFLASPLYGLNQWEIAVFALVGAIGALAAPIAGRLADNGFSQLATGGSLVIVALSFLLGYLGTSGSLMALLVAGILLDLGVQSNLVLGQRAIFTLKADIRSRLNGLYMAIFFFGGAIGSSIASVCFLYGGWSLVSWIGFAFPIAALAFYMTEFRK